ncbi:hypothetical protein TNCV_3661941 [Trichonephila clavipes]|nr:hypothetical protein TNCV_3661941 [Trichonephila clavipes]
MAPHHEMSATQALENKPKCTIKDLLFIKSHVFSREGLMLLNVDYVSVPYRRLLSNTRAIGNGPRKFEIRSSDI